MKTPLVFSLALLAVFASAQTLVSGTRGKGEATTQDGRMAKFEVTASQHEGAAGGVLQEGRVEFEQMANTAGPMVLIRMKGPSFVRVNGNVCDYSGEGHLKTLIAGKERTIHGKVEVETVNGGKGMAGDSFEIHFVGKDGLKFTFRGSLVKRNVSVYTHEKA